MLLRGSHCTIFRDHCEDFVLERQCVTGPKAPKAQVKWAVRCKERYSHETYHSICHLYFWMCQEWWCKVTKAHNLFSQLQSKYMGVNSVKRKNTNKQTQIWLFISTVFLIYSALYSVVNLSNAIIVLCDVMLSERIISQFDLVINKLVYSSVGWQNLVSQKC